MTRHVPQLIISTPKETSPITPNQSGANSSSERGNAARNNVSADHRGNANASRTDTFSKRRKPRSNSTSNGQRYRFVSSATTVIARNTPRNNQSKGSGSPMKLRMRKLTTNSTTITTSTSTITVLLSHLRRIVPKNVEKNSTSRPRTQGARTANNPAVAAGIGRMITDRTNQTRFDSTNVMARSNHDPGS